MSMRIASICRYPVKGLSAESQERVTLTPGKCLPHDRRFALALAATEFDPAQPQWLPKTRFAMLMRDEKLAQLRTRFDEHSGMFTIDRDRKTILRAKITDPDGRRQIDDFFAEFLKDGPRGAPRIVEASGHTFADARPTTGQYVSLLNLASVRALERVVKVPVDPLRFRANLHFGSAPEWVEFEWVGSEIAIGDARLRVVSPIERCAATAVNPDTAERDLNIPAILRREFGHLHMGVYAEVIAGGEIRTEDRLRIGLLE